MSIRLSRRDTALPLSHEINVTPFIDVMLVLLIIFMVAAPLATVDVKVDLPASTAKPAAKPEKPVFLSVQADGQLLVNEEAVTPASLPQAIITATKADRQQRIYLRADKTVPYEKIMQAMNGLRAAGYLQVALVGEEATGAAIK